MCQRAEVAAIGTGKSSGAEAADGSALPVAVVDHAGRGECGLAAAGIFERHANAALPGGFGDGVAGETQRSEEKAKRQTGEEQAGKTFHGHSSGSIH